MITTPPTPEKPSPEALEAADELMRGYYFDRFAIARALDRFAAAAVEAERERCRRVAGAYTRYSNPEVRGAAIKIEARIQRGDEP